MLKWWIFSIMTIWCFDNSLCDADCWLASWLLSTEHPAPTWERWGWEQSLMPTFCQQTLTVGEMKHWYTKIQSLTVNVCNCLVYNSEHLSWAQFKQNKENTTCKILVKLTLHTLHSLQHSHKACFRGNMEPSLPLYNAFNSLVRKRTYSLFS